MKFNEVMDKLDALMAIGVLTGYRVERLGPDTGYIDGKLIDYILYHFYRDYLNYLRVHFHADDNGDVITCVGVFVKNGVPVYYDCSLEELIEKAEDLVVNEKI